MLTVYTSIHPTLLNPWSDLSQYSWWDTTPWCEIIDRITLLQWFQFKFMANGVYTHTVFPPQPEPAVATPFGSEFIIRSANYSDYWQFSEFSGESMAAVTTGSVPTMLTAVKNLCTTLRNATGYQCLLRYHVLTWHMAGDIPVVDTYEPAGYEETVEAADWEAIRTTMPYSVLNDIYYGRRWTWYTMAPSVPDVDIDASDYSTWYAAMTGLRAFLDDLLTLQRVPFTKTKTYNTSTWDFLSTREYENCRPLGGTFTNGGGSYYDWHEIDTEAPHPHDGGEPVITEDVPSQTMESYVGCKWIEYRGDGEEADPTDDHFSWKHKSQSMSKVITDTWSDIIDNTTAYNVLIKHISLSMTLVNHFNTTGFDDGLAPGIDFSPLAGGDDGRVPEWAAYINGGGLALEWVDEGAIPKRLTGAGNPSYPGPGQGFYGFTLADEEDDLPSGDITVFASIGHGILVNGKDHVGNGGEWFDDWHYGWNGRHFPGWVTSSYPDLDCILEATMKLSMTVGCTVTFSYEVA